MAKPNPASIPTIPGLYWIKFAQWSHSMEKGWCWDKPEISEWTIAFCPKRSPKNPNYYYVDVIGSDEGIPWGIDTYDSGYVVIDVRPGPIPPQN